MYLQQGFTLATEYNNGKLDLHDVQITSTIAYNLDLLSEKISLTLNELEKNGINDVEELNDLKLLVTKMPENTDNRLAMEFRIRELEKLSINRVVNTNINNSEIEDYLINLDLSDFINLGKLGRKWVVKKVEGLGISKYNDLLLDAVKELIQSFKLLFNILIQSENHKDVLEALKEFQSELNIKEHDFEEMTNLWLMAKRNKCNTLQHIYDILQS